MKKIRENHRQIITKVSVPAVAAVCFCLGGNVFGATVGSLGSGVWTDGAVWDDGGNPPGSGNDYEIASGDVIESPSGSASVSFAGDSLTVLSGGTLEIYRNIGGSTGQAVTATIPNLTVAGGTLRSRVGFATGTATLASALSFDGGGTIEVGTNLGSFTHTFNLDGAIDGTGSVNVFRTSQGTGRIFNINGDTSGFAGNWNFATNSGTSPLQVTLNSGSNGWGTGDLSVGDLVTLSLNGDFELISSNLLFEGNNTILNLNGDVVVGGLSIGSNSVNPGVYGAADLADLGFGGSFSGVGSLTVIPEPSSAWLGVTGLMLLWRRRVG